MDVDIINYISYNTTGRQTERESFSSGSHSTFLSTCERPVPPACAVVWQANGSVKIRTSYAQMRTDTLKPAFRISSYFLLALVRQAGSARIPGCLQLFFSAAVVENGFKSKTVRQEAIMRGSRG